MPRKLLFFAFALAFAPLLAHAGEAQTGAPPGVLEGARAADPLANLKPYEERRYRIDMQDCGKQAGVDRRVCERGVSRKAASKSRRRAATGR